LSIQARHATQADGPVRQPCARVDYIPQSRTKNLASRVFWAELFPTSVHFTVYTGSLWQTLLISVHNPHNLLSAEFFSSLANQASFFKIKHTCRFSMRLEIISSHICAGILDQSMGARNRVGIGLLHRPAARHKLTESIPWN
jgi:hypothetical protein